MSSRGLSLLVKSHRALRVYSNPTLTPTTRLQTRSISAYGYEQAKALVFSQHGNPSDVLSLHSHSLSPPHGDLLTLRTLAAPLNPADINQIQGTYPSRPTFTTSLSTPQPVAVPGNEAVFEILSTGSGVKSLKKGDWVLPSRTGLGCWRTHLQCQEHDVYKIQKEDTNVKAAATVGVNGVTAFRLLTEFGYPNPYNERTREVEVLPEGEGGWYIQNGANSGVGRMVSQIGRLRGYKGIAVVRAREDKKEEEELKKEMLDLGAEKCVTDEEAAAKTFKEEVAEWTKQSDTPLQLGLNCVGGDAALSMAKVMAKHGTIVTYGAMARAPMKVPAGMLIFNDLRFVGFWVSEWAKQQPREKEQTVNWLLHAYRHGNLKEQPSVDVQWNWETKAEELKDAVQGTLEGYRKGKGIFVFGET